MSGRPCHRAPYFAGISGRLRVNLMFRNSRIARCCRDHARRSHQVEEIWDRFLHGFVFVTVLLLDLLPREIKRTLFFFWGNRFLEKKHFETQRDELVGAVVRIALQAVPIFL